MQANDASEKHSSPRVFRRWDDGFVVRAMTPGDARIVQKWFCGFCVISPWDLDIALQVFPQGHGMYIGEINGEVVASAIRIPWTEKETGPQIFYGSYYYVKEGHRSKGYGTRLRDQVARGYVGENILVIDAVMGSVASTNLKHGYTSSFITGRYIGVAKETTVNTNFQGKITDALSLPFDEVMAYDDKNFVSPKSPIRRRFIKKWLAVEGGISRVAVDGSGHIVGLLCRRPCLKEKDHEIGPLYADTPEIATALLQDACRDIVGECFTINIWRPNEDVLGVLEKFDMAFVFDLQHMTINMGNLKDFKPTVYGVTSVDVCGF